MNTYLLFLLFVCASPVLSLNCVKNLVPVHVTASDFQEGHPPGNVRDNNYTAESRWSAKGEGVWITFDLGSSQQICSLSVAWWQASTRTNYYVVSVSSNNVTYSQVTSGNSANTADVLQVYSFAATTARYVRLTVNGNSVNLWASVLEMRATGPGFVHPGVIVRQSQLNFAKAKIQASAQPWANVFNVAKNSRVGKITYTPGAVSVLSCGSGSWNDAHPNDPTTAQCTRARDDAEAAWTLALLWQFTGDIRYAQTSITILNAWKNTLTTILFTGGGDASTSNGPLQAAWMAELFIRAAELIRHGAGGSGWSSTDATQFGTWLQTVIYPFIYKGWWGGNNWDLSMIDGLISMAVYTENQTMFNSAISLWTSHIPQYIYMTADGPKPIVIYGSTNVDATWKNPPLYFNGLAQETCRDFGHTQMGFAGIINTAETAYLQGHPELYATYQTRIVTAFEFHAYYLNLGNPTVPSWLCNGQVNLLTPWATWEIFYNHYHFRQGLTLANSTTLVNYIRAHGPYTSNLVAAWEVLTHCQDGTV